MRGLPIVCSVLLVCGVFTTNGESVSTTPNVVIDGYTVSSTITSTAALSLGTTVILVCRISGIPHGLQTNYHWTCPNEPCQQKGYAGRKINNNIITINITSTSDGGTYTCKVTAGGREDSQWFQLNVNGGQVVHSYGRLIFNESVITDKQQLQPPNNDRGDGRIECRVSSGNASFSYHGRPVPTGTSGDVHQIISGSTATLVIRDRAFNNFVNFEGKCAYIYHYLFLSNGTLPDVNITGPTRTDTSITVNIGTIPSGIDRVIIGYHRLDLGVPVVGGYWNNMKGSSTTFSSLVPGAKYRITAWGLGGGDDRRRSQSPAVREVTTKKNAPSSPRQFTITRVFHDGIELNWIPPREPNGDIQRYIIKYTTQDRTQEINTTNNINYYNLTGLERGQTYNDIRVVAVNSTGGRRGSQPIISYVHNPTVESTMSPGTSTPSPTTSTPTTTTSTPTTTAGMPTEESTSNPSSTSQNGGPTVPTTAGLPIPLIVGVVVVAIIVLILTTLLIIVVVLLIKHKKKRDKNKSSTVHVYNDVLGHCDKVEDTKPDTVYYSAVGEPPGNGDVNTSIVEDDIGPLYDDVDKPMKQLECDQGTFPQECYDDTVTQNTTQPGVKTTGLGPISTADAEQELETEETTDLVDAIYTVPDKSKKKNKGKKKDNKEQEMYHTGGPTCDPLSSTEEKEDESPIDPEQLYTAVDMTKKKKEK